MSSSSTSGTLVDVVIFAPVGLVSGTIGSFFKEFGFTVAATTLMSLVVSFTLTPMLASKLLRSGTDLEEYRTSGKELGRAYRETFGSHYPAMAVVQVAGLVEKAAKIEIEATAVVAE